MAQTEGTSGKSNTGVIIASIVGGLVLLVGGGFAIKYFMDKGKEGAAREDEGSDTGAGTGTGSPPPPELGVGRAATSAELSVRLPSEYYPKPAKALMKGWYLPTHMNMFGQKPVHILEWMQEITKTPTTWGYKSYKDGGMIKLAEAAAWQSCRQRGGSECQG